MKNVSATFLEYLRLERKRSSSGLSVRELERWTRLKSGIDGHMRNAAGAKHAARSSVRVPTRLLCSFASRSDFDKAVITNLSAGGVFIATTSPLPIGEKLTLHLRVRGAGSEIEVKGVIVSNNVGRNLQSGEAGMGVRFSEVSSEAARALQDLYERELERDVEESEDAPDRSPRPARELAGSA